MADRSSNAATSPVKLIGIIVLGVWLGVMVATGSLWLASRVFFSQELGALADAVQSLKNPTPIIVQAPPAPAPVIVQAAPTPAPASPARQPANRVYSETNQWAEADRRYEADRERSLNELRTSLGYNRMNRINAAGCESAMRHYAGNPTKANSDNISRQCF